MGSFGKWANIVFDWLFFFLFFLSLYRLIGRYLNGFLLVGAPIQPLMAGQRKGSKCLGISRAFLVWHGAPLEGDKIVRTFV